MKRRISTILLSLCMAARMMPRIALIVLMSLVLTVPVSTTSFAAGISYSDVKPSDWYYEFVQYVSERGIMTGYGNGRFGVCDKMTRGQFATILYRMEGSPDVAYGYQFPDVKKGKFYSIPITWANKNGIMTGYSNGYFGVNDPITREQIVTIFFRYSDSKGYDVSAYNDFSDFPDAGKVSGFAQDAMYWAMGEGLIAGDQGYINPQGNTKRAEMAALIQRYQEHQPPEHTHDWAEQFATIHHEEISHIEEVQVLEKEAWTETVPVYETVARAICNGCDADITDDPGSHMKEQMLAGNMACGGYHVEYREIQTGMQTVEHPAEYRTEEKIVIDQEAFDEKIFIGYKCPICGAMKN